ncbi:MAG: peptide ABC transporter permease [Gemmatimonadetes bacterium]|nr:peptide ABC transporter permease [Gemmatimonadota bacterium]|tara:strand:- start:2361 stop:3536 length:1176 start_codon:yes stop_codon:yes gene_type:complete
MGADATTFEQLKGYIRSWKPGSSNGEVDEEARVLVASQWQLMWWKFRKHKLAKVAGVVLILFYLVAVFCEFVAPHDPHSLDTRYIHAPPQPIRFFDAEGGFHFRPFVYRHIQHRDPLTFRLDYNEDHSRRYPIYLFPRGDSYLLWDVFESDRHLFGLGNGEKMLLMGADRMGRDLLSRIAYGARISLSIGLIGISISFVLGLIMGGISGYFGGRIDDIIQRIIEFIMGIPGLPLWMTLSAALPPDWPIIRVYFGITIILAFVGWTGLARVVRGRFLALREEDFVMAARLAGAKERRIIAKHMVPSFLSYIIASLTLSIPQMILGETALSFIGLGLRAPAISWGVLLQDAMNIRAVAHHPWLLLPGIFVIFAVLAFNFLGDGLRDAADPYTR